jgi:hypothetical protein
MGNDSPGCSSYRRVPERALDRVCARGQGDRRQMPSGHRLGGHDHAVGRITDRNDPRPRFSRPGRASGFGPQSKRSSDDVQPAYQLRWACGDQGLAYPWPLGCRAATHRIHPHSHESPVPSFTGGLSADRLDLRSLRHTLRVSGRCAPNRAGWRPGSRVEAWSLDWRVGLQRLACRSQRQPGSAPRLVGTMSKMPIGVEEMRIIVSEQSGAQPPREMSNE